MSFEIIDIGTQKDFQDIKIPEKFMINDDKAYITKVGNAIYIVPYHNSWNNMINAVQDFSEDFMEDREQPLNTEDRETFDL